MSENTTTPTTRREQRKAGKRRPIVAFGLATLAVGGIGAAMTSAAWTDNVFFSAQADAATFDLEGSVDGGKTWLQSDNEEKIELIVPASEFAKLLPGETRTVTLDVRNNGNVNATLVGSAVWADSQTTFAQDPKVAVSDLEATLAPAGTDSFTLTVTTPDDWSTDNKGKAGVIVVTVSGEATS